MHFIRKESSKEEEYREQLSIIASVEAELASWDVYNKDLIQKGEQRQLERSGKAVNNKVADRMKNRIAMLEKVKDNETDSGQKEKIQKTIDRMGRGLN